MTTRPAAPAMSAQSWLLLLALATLWGGSFFFFKILAAALPPLTVVLARVGLGALMLNAWIVVRGGRMPRDMRLWRQFIVMGILNNVIPFALFVTAEREISSGLAAILNATTPMFTVLVAHGLTRDEKLTGERFAGVLAGFCGVAVLIGPQAFAGLGHDSLASQIACLGAALSYAFAAIYGRRFRGLDPVKVATGQVSGSTLVLIPLVLAIDRPWTLPMPGIAIWAAMIAIALLCTALAYILFFRILAQAGASNVALVTLLLPFAAMALGALFLGEQVPLRAVSGLVLIGLGFALIDGRLLRRTVRWFNPLAQAG
jgi:drug/metabolite transporter (DMT)-like permease